MGHDDDSDFEKVGRKHALIAISLKDRRLLWRFEGKTPGQALCCRPVVVHFNSSSGVTALDSSSGKVIWEHRIAGHFQQTLRYDGRLLCVGGRTRSVYALDPDSGKIVWEYTLPRPASGGFAVGGGGVFVGCNDHHVYALSSADGRLMWRRDLGFNEWNSPLAWVTGHFLRTTIGTFSVADGTFDSSLRLNDEERVSEVDRLLVEKIQGYPRRLEIDLRTTCLYLDDDLAFVVRAEDKHRTFMNLFDVVNGTLLRRFSLNDRPISGLCRGGDIVVVSVSGQLMVFSIENVSAKDA
jgi:hypothetical protein